jgi:forkhead box protein D
MFDNGSFLRRRKRFKRHRPPAGGHLHHPFPLPAALHCPHPGLLLGAPVPPQPVPATYSAAAPGIRRCALLHPHPLRYLLLSAPAYGRVPPKAEGADLASPAALAALQPSLGPELWKEGKDPASQPGGGCASFSIDSIMQGVSGSGVGTAPSLSPTPWGYSHLLQRPSCLLHHQAAVPLLRASAAAARAILLQQHGGSNCAPRKGTLPGQHLPAVAALQRYQHAAKDSGLTSPGPPLGYRGDLVGLLSSSGPL